MLQECINREKFIRQMRSFLAAHGGPNADVNGLLDYATKKGRAGFNELGVEWFAEINCIKFHKEWSGFSFFDDGGGVVGFRDWSFTFIGNEKAGLLIENEKLEDLSGYKADNLFKADDLFYVKDPFGLKGIFEVRLYEEEEHVD